MEESILETHKLTRRYGSLVAVNEVTFTVHRGEIFGLIGANGAGKTTTIKMLTTLLHPTSGSARVAGFDVVGNARNVRRSIGYVPQLVSADGNLTGYENLLLFAKLYDIPSSERGDRIHKALEFMELSDAKDNLVKTYSGGMIRRLEIAQAVLHRPRILFLDEPTVGLDPVARQSVWKQVETLAQYGTTVILTTHYMEEAESMCTHVAVMHKGKIVANGTPAELKKSVGGTKTTLDDVFAFYSGGINESGGGYREASSVRVPQSALADEGVRIGVLESAIQFIRKTFVIAELEVRKLRHDPTELLTRALQPALWMLIFGEVFSHLHAIPTGSLDYLDFMAPGILAQSVLFAAIFYGIAIIWERDLGIIHKFLVSPTPRSALVLGKALSAGVRGLSQAIIIYLLSLALGVEIDWNPLSLVGIMAFVFLGSALFSTFSLIIACIVKTRERFMGIGQVMTMPLFFASNAIYPIEIMPGWLKAIAHINPLTYEVDALRGLMLVGGTSVFGLPFDFAAMAIATTILVIIGALLYPSVVA